MTGPRAILTDMNRLVLLPLLLLGACDWASDAPSPNAPTASERRALDDAAEMIEDQRLPASAIPPAQASEAAAAPTEKASAPPG